MTVSLKGELRLKAKIRLKKNRVFHLDGGLSSQNRNATRYLDPKYSRWMSCDPKAAEYMDGKNANSTSGGIYSLANFNLYHYSNNNPVKYVDPNGKDGIDKDYLKYLNDNNIPLSQANSDATIQGYKDFQASQPPIKFNINSAEEGSQFLSGLSTVAAIFGVMRPDVSAITSIVGLVTGLGSAGAEVSQGNLSDAGKGVANSLLSFFGGGKIGKITNSNFAGALAGLVLNFSTDEAKAFGNALKDAQENPQGKTAGDFNKIFEKYGHGNFDFSKDFSKEDFKMDFMQLVKDYEANKQNQGEQQ